MVRPRSGKLDRLLQHVPLRLARACTPRTVFPLFYHVVSSETLPHIEHLYDYKSPEQFERDLAFLKQRFHVATYEELVAHQNGTKRLPSGSVTLTFDDGLAECHSIVRPLLVKYGLPCTFFVCANFMDNRSMMFRNAVSLCLSALEALSDEQVRTAAGELQRSLGVQLEGREALASWVHGLTYGERAHVTEVCSALGVDIPAYLATVRPYMTSEQILDLHRDGFTIGAHTCDHPELWRLDWPDVVREIVDSCQVVRDLTGRDEVPFAIPFNGARLDRDALAELQRTTEGLGLIFDTNNLRIERDFLVNRVWCDSPVGAAPGASNVPHVMRRAHTLEPLRAARRLLRRGS